MRGKRGSERNQKKEGKKKWFFLERKNPKELFADFGTLDGGQAPAIQPTPSVSAHRPGMAVHQAIVVTLRRRFGRMLAELLRLGAA